MKPFFQSRKGVVAGAIAIACAVLPRVSERPKPDRFFAPGSAGEEKAAGGKQNAEATAVGFKTRYLYGGGGEKAREWERRNGIGSRIDFSHNLNNLFPPSEYTWHPEFFPLVEGERLQPPRGSYFWQPDLGRQDVAAWAAEAARRHFQAHPDAVSFAVGVNDGLIFGESEETLKLIQGRKQKAESRKERARGIHEPHGMVDSRKEAQEAQNGQTVNTSNTERRTSNLELGTRNIEPGTPNREPKELPTEHTKHTEAEQDAGGTETQTETADYADGLGSTLNSQHSTLNSLSSEGSAKEDQLSAANAIRFFRERPDFTDLVYTFTNRVAREVAAKHPDKYIGALAYYWCEDAPGFPLEPNVIPFLTADRSQGYDERFREEERELQRAWARAHGMDNPRNTVDSGRGTVNATLNTQHSALNSAEPTLPRRLGLYDYLYGSGFLIPRVHTRLIADNLRQAWRFGFTDYFAELNPNWGLDGPMAWMVAQLLQDPERSREVLLDEYYSRYFHEAAVPMRRFFERCEYQWLTQPGPAYWLKHYRNESQARLFSSAVCRELRALLNEATRQARDEITKKRVAFVSDTFGVTERFVEFCESRDALNREILQRNHGIHETHEKSESETGLTADHTDGRGFALNTQLSTLNSLFVQARAEFVTYTMALMEREPQALAPFVWADYLRHTPPLEDKAGSGSSSAKASTSARPTGDRTADRDATSSDRADLVAKAMATVVSGSGASQPQAFNLPSSRQVKPFTEFRDLTAGPIAPAWTIGGLRYGVALPEGWQSYVEPSEFQSAELRDGILRLEGNKETFVYQWIPAGAGAAYRTRVRVRGRVESGTTVILALSWLDAQQRRLGSKVHRLPDGEWPEWVTLEVKDVAPAGTAWVGLGLRVQNQMGAEWVEARAFTLERTTVER